MKNTDTKRKEFLWIAGGSTLLFLLLILLVRTVDVAAIGPEGTSIGLSHLNGAVHEILVYRPFWYALTEYLGYVALLVAAGFAGMGLLQLIRRRSLRKVDRPILALGVLFAVVILLYVVFEVLVINYRPVILPGEAGPEASFPSSHTVLSCVIFGSAAMLSARYVRRMPWKRLLPVLCTFLMMLTVIGRLLSGVHWCTDILGGVLMSIALLSVYKSVLITERDRS